MHHQVAEPGIAVPLSGAFPLSKRITQLPFFPLILDHLRSLKQTLLTSPRVGQSSKTERLSLTTDGCGNTCAPACVHPVHAWWVCTLVCVRVLCVCRYVHACVCVSEEAANRTNYYGITETWNPITGTL